MKNSKNVIVVPDGIRYFYILRDSTVDYYLTDWQRGSFHPNKSIVEFHDDLKSARRRRTIMTSRDWFTYYDPVASAAAAAQNPYGAGADKGENDRYVTYSLNTTRNWSVAFPHTPNIEILRVRVDLNIPTNLEVV